MGEDTAGDAVGLGVTKKLKPEKVIGTGVGGRVGSWVRPGVGSEVGSPEGMCDGINEGFLEGLLLGCMEGPSLGCVEGAVVGYSVVCLVTSALGPAVDSDDIWCIDKAVREDVGVVLVRIVPVVEGSCEGLSVAARVGRSEDLTVGLVVVEALWAVLGRAVSVGSKRSQSIVSDARFACQFCICKQDRTRTFLNLPGSKVFPVSKTESSDGATFA